MSFLQYITRHARASGQYVSEMPAQLITAPNEFPERVTIGEPSDLVSDDVLLNIFRYYLDVSPRHHWPMLAHICRRWRRIVFASQRALHIRIFCTHGTPVLKTLCCWPATTIIVRFGGSLEPELSPPALKDEDNIITTLKHSGRVSSIHLTTTKSLLKTLSSIKTPFSELEDLVLLSRDGIRLTLPSAFRWGPRLRYLHSTRIAIPGLIQLLYYSTNLVDLRLRDVLDSWQFPPEALTDALSGMAQLQSLSLHFLSTTNYRARIPQSWRHALLPLLTRLDIRGIPLYLERLVARIDAPRLGDIELTFLNGVTIGFPTLLEFIDRTGMQKSHRRVHISSSERAISISLIQPAAPSCLKLHLIRQSPSEQLLFMTRVCLHLSSFLSNVEDLRISTTRPSGRGDSDYSGWTDLLNSFTGVKWVHFDWDHTTNILQIPDRRYENMLPSLYKLYISRPGQRRAPLGEAVVSFMVSRRLSGHHIAVEYERLSYINELRGTDPLPPSQQVTIETLSDDIFLNIFRYYLEATPRAWSTLTYVCQRWRQIVHTSPLGLNLRLYFMPGTPVLNALDCWTALPIMVQYGGFSNLDPSAPEDDDNIIAALKQPSRVSSISLTVTQSLLESLSTIPEPFSELEELVLLSRANVQLTLSGTFRWGPRLRTLHSTRIAFPSLPQLLSLSHDLVDIQLHEIPSSGYFPPEAFANALSGMTNLRTLSLHFLTLPPRRNYGLPPLSGDHVVLPALMSLKYRGTSKYLDALVTRIDAPSLKDIDITFFSQPTIDASQLGRFIERTGMPRTLRQAEVQTSGHAISISFTSSGTSTLVRFQISCKQLDWQLSSMVQVCDQISPFHIETLGINTTQSSSGQDDADVEQWLELIHSFSNAKGFCVAGVHTKDILCALRPAHVHTTNQTVLPALRNLRVAEPIAMDGPSWDAVRTLITSRSLSGRPVQFTALSYQCHICYARSRQQHDLEDHLEREHGYQKACLYCDNFQCVPGYHFLFPEHIKSEHPEVAHNDALISGPVLERFTPSQLNSVVNRHSSPRAPVPISMDSDTGRDPGVA